MKNWLTGKTAEMSGCIRSTPLGRVPAVYIKTRAHWFAKAEVDVIDLISFLLVAEKLAEHKDYSQDFVYKAKHEAVDFDLSIPAWAVEELQQRAAILGPITYESLKEGDKKMIEMAKQFGMQNPEKYSAISKYKELHAQVNGYQLSADNSQEKVIH